MTVPRSGDVATVGAMRQAKMALEVLLHHSHLVGAAVLRAESNLKNQIRSILSIATVITT